MKTIILSVSIVLCASMFTSCHSYYQYAYEAECNYRLAKEGVIYHQSDTTRFKQEFESIYRFLDDRSQITYKKYRSEQKRFENEARNEYIRDSKDMVTMLND